MISFSKVYTPAPHFDEESCKAFLTDNGYQIVEAIGSDFSIRRYFRVRKNNQTAILMETVPDDSKHMTRGHKMSDFIEVSVWLREVGLSAPEIYTVDERRGYMLLEDFASTSLATHGDKKESYHEASNVLKHLAQHSCSLDLTRYQDSHVHQGRTKIIDFYLPSRGLENDGLVKGYLAAWEEIETKAPPPQIGFIHVDYHAENLMWLNERSTINRIGILDFQGAMIGPVAYDLANLLEDARCDIGDNLRQEILSRFDENTRHWYRILATQFHCRVIGQFIQIAQEKGDETYLKHIPRLERYIEQALQDPILEPLRVFFQQINLDFSA